MMLKRGLGFQAADYLRDLIVSGELEPGSQITEEGLSAQLGVSRGTIRTSIQQLVHEGIIRYEPYKGNYIHRLSSHDVWEIYTLRNSLEGLASRLAAETITEDGVKQLMAALSDLDTVIRSNQQRDIVNADFALHSVIFSLSNHKRLIEQYRQLESLTRLYMNVLVGYRPDLAEMYVEHVHLVEAIMDGDGDLAEKIARNHNVVDGEFLRQQLVCDEDKG